MPVFDVKDVGEVLIRRSSLAKNLSIRIDHDGNPKVTIPRRMPYYLAKSMVTSKKDWILANRRHTPVLYDGQEIGGYGLRFYPAKISAPTHRSSEREVHIKYPEDIDITDSRVQMTAQKAIKSAIKKRADAILPSIIYQLAKKHDFKYEEVKIRSLKSRWGSCSTRGVITLNMWLATLPYELIEYVCCHELAHLKHHNHSRSFWAEVETMLSDYRESRKVLKTKSPSLHSLF